MTRLLDQLIATIGTLALGFALGCQFAGRYIYSQTTTVPTSNPPAWVTTVQQASWIGFALFGLAVLTIITLDYQRRPTTTTTTPEVDQ